MIIKDGRLFDDKAWAYVQKLIKAVAKQEAMHKGYISVQPGYSAYNPIYIINSGRKITRRPNLDELERRL